MTYIHGVSFQIKAFFQVVGLGFLLGILYDVFRFLRWLTGNRFCAVWDVLFCLISAFADFCFILAFHDGLFRTYLFVGEAVGFGAYYLALGRLNFRLGASVTRVIRHRGSRVKTFFQRRGKAVWGRMKTRKETSGNEAEGNRLQ